MLPVVHCGSAALSHYICLQSPHTRIVWFKMLAANRMFDAPVYHIPQQCDSAQLRLELRIRFRMSVGGVWMAHIARDGNGAAKQIRTVKNTRTFHNELLGLTGPYQQISFRWLAVNVSFGLAALE